MPTPSSSIDLCGASELANGEQRVFAVDGREILLIRSGSEHHAMINQCSHLSKALYGGRVVGRTIYCPFHGACFNFTTGKALSGPAVDPITVLPVTEENGRIIVKLPTISP